MQHTSCGHIRLPGLIIAVVGFLAFLLRGYEEGAVGVSNDVHGHGSSFTTNWLHVDLFLPRRSRRENRGSGAFGDQPLLGAVDDAPVGIERDERSEGLVSVP